MTDNPKLEGQAENLKRDTLDALLTHVRSMETPWSKLSEQDQQDKIEALDRTATNLVRRAVHMAAGNGFEHVPATIQNVQLKSNKDGPFIEGKMVSAFTQVNYERLGDCFQDSVLILMVDAETYMANDTLPDADPDEPKMDLQDDEDDAGEDEEEDTKALPAPVEALSGPDDDDVSTDEAA
ncbi:MAG: hypothetical protein AAGI12_15540 [Pseudomonadota bacterium]